MVASVRKVNDDKQFLLDGVAFLGRTLDEYVDMFNFRPDDWIGYRVLDCASGPASFNAEANEMGIHAVSCDPLYMFNLQELLPKAEQDLRLCSIKSGMQKDLFDAYSADSDKQTRWVAEKQRALFTFSRDYSRGKADGRYVVGSLPHLPFANETFDLVLSGHFLFTYASKSSGGMLNEERFPLSFHLEAINEMLRVSRNEVRIYPLKGPNSKDNPLLSAVLEYLKSQGVKAELEIVGYKDIAGANLMLRIRKNH